MADDVIAIGRNELDRSRTLGGSEAVDERCHHPPVIAERGQMKDAHRGMSSACADLMRII